MEKIILIEDDADIREMLKDYLSGEGYEITSYIDGVSIFNEINFNNYILALVDLMLPKGNGFEIIKKIREISTIPIIIITAKNSDSDKARGLSLGADDYVTKPFSIVELSARIKANIRRVSKYDMQYVVMHRKAEEDVDLFSDNDEDAEVINPITPEQYQTLMEYLEERNKPAILPVQIASSFFFV